MTAIASRLRSALRCLGLGAVVGCGGVDESRFSPTPGTAPPEAPRTPEEYDAKFPLRDQGGRKSEP